MVLKARTVEELRGHAAELAAAYNVLIHWDASMAPDDGKAVTLGPIQIVFHKPIEDESDYAGVLHEIGHCAAALGIARPDRRPLTLEARLEGLNFVLVRERAAWDWAVHNAELFGQWTAAMESVRAICLADYEKGVAKAKAELVAARDAAVADRNLRGSEPIGHFVGRAADGVPAPGPRHPRISRGESVADFLGRSDKK